MTRHANVSTHCAVTSRMMDELTRDDDVSAPHTVPEWAASNRSAPPRHHLISRLVIRLRARPLSRADDNLRRDTWIIGSIIIVIISVTSTTIAAAAAAAAAASLIWLRSILVLRQCTHLTPSGLTTKHEFVQNPHRRPIIANFVLRGNGNNANRFSFAAKIAKTACKIYLFTGNILVCLKLNRRNICAHFMKEFKL